MTFLAPRRTLGFKLEAVPYTAETLAATDYDLSAYDINYSPEIAMYARKIARGNFGHEAAIAGKQTVTVTFAVDLQEGAAVNTVPTYMKCLIACCMSETAYTTTGVGIALSSNITGSPATIEIVEKEEGTSPRQVVIRARGCMGNARFVVNSIGEPCKIEFEFKGALVSIANRAFGSILTPTGFDTVLPDAVMGVSVMAFGAAQTLNKCTIDLGNDVQIYTDPAKVEGVSGAHVVNRTPAIEIDPDFLSPSDQDFWDKWQNSTEGTFSMRMSANTVFSSSSIQVNSAYAPGEREGHVTNSIKLIIRDDDFEILQGSKT